MSGLFSLLFRRNTPKKPLSIIPRRIGEKIRKGIALSVTACLLLNIADLSVLAADSRYDEMQKMKKERDAQISVFRPNGGISPAAMNQPVSMDKNNTVKIGNQAVGYADPKAKKAFIMQPDGSFKEDKAVSEKLFSGKKDTGKGVGYDQQKNRLNASGPTQATPAQNQQNPQAVTDGKADQKISVGTAKTDKAVQSQQKADEAPKNEGITEHKEGQQNIEQQLTTGKKLDESADVAVVTMARVQELGAAKGVRLVATTVAENEVNAALKQGGMIAHLKNIEGGADLFTAISKDGTVTYTEKEGTVVATTMAVFKEESKDRYQWTGKVLQTAGAASAETLDGTTKTGTKGTFDQALISNIAGTASAVMNTVQGVRQEAVSTQTDGSGAQKAISAVTSWLTQFIGAAASKQQEMIQAMAQKLGIAASELKGLTAEKAQQIISYLKAQGEKVINCAVEAISKILTLGLVKHSKSDVAATAILVDILTGNFNTSDSQMQLSMYAIQKTAGSYGVNLNGYATDMAGLAKLAAAGPAVAHLTLANGQDHFVTVTGVKDGMIYYAEKDSSGKMVQKSMSAEDWSKYWTGTVMSSATGVTGVGQAMSVSEMQKIRGSAFPTKTYALQASRPASGTSTSYSTSSNNSAILAAAAAEAAARRSAAAAAAARAAEEARRRAAEARARAEAAARARAEAARKRAEAEARARAAASAAAKKREAAAAAERQAAQRRTTLAQAKQRAAASQKKQVTSKPRTVAPSKPIQRTSQATSSARRSTSRTVAPVKRQAINTSSTARRASTSAPVRTYTPQPAVRTYQPPRTQPVFRYSPIGQNVSSAARNIPRASYTSPVSIPRNITSAASSITSNFIRTAPLANRNTAVFTPRYSPVNAASSTSQTKSAVISSAGSAFRSSASPFGPALQGPSSLSRKYTAAGAGITSAVRSTFGAGKSNAGWGAAFARKFGQSNSRVAAIQNSPYRVTESFTVDRPRLMKIRFDVQTYSGVAAASEKLVEIKSHAIAAKAATEWGAVLAKKAGIVEIQKPVMVTPTPVQQREAVRQYVSMVEKVAAQERKDGIVPGKGISVALIEAMRTNPALAEHMANANDALIKSAYNSLKQNKLIPSKTVTAASTANKVLRFEQGKASVMNREELAQHSYAATEELKAYKAMVEKVAAQEAKDGIVPGKGIPIALLSAMRTNVTLAAQMSNSNNSLIKSAYNTLKQGGLLPSDSVTAASTADKVIQFEQGEGSVMTREEQARTSLYEDARRYREMVEAVAAQEARDGIVPGKGTPVALISAMRTNVKLLSLTLSGSNNTLIKSAFNVLKKNGLIPSKDVTAASMANKIIQFEQGKATVTTPEEQVLKSYTGRIELQNFRTKLEALAAQETKDGIVPGKGTPIAVIEAMRANPTLAYHMKDSKNALIKSAFNTLKENGLIPSEDVTAASMSNKMLQFDQGKASVLIRAQQDPAAETNAAGPSSAQQDILGMTLHGQPIREASNTGINGEKLYIVQVAMVDENGQQIMVEQRKTEAEVRAMVGAQQSYALTRKLIDETKPQVDWLDAYSRADEATRLSMVTDESAASLGMTRSQLAGLSAQQAATMRNDIYLYRGSAATGPGNGVFTSGAGMIAQAVKEAFDPTMQVAPKTDPWAVSINEKKLSTTFLKAGWEWGQNVTKTAQRVAAERKALEDETFRIEQDGITYQRVASDDPDYHGTTYKAVFINGVPIENIIDNANSSNAAAGGVQTEDRAARMNREIIEQIMNDPHISDEEKQMRIEEQKAIYRQTLNEQLGNKAKVDQAMATTFSGINAAFISRAQMSAQSSAVYDPNNPEKSRKAAQLANAQYYLSNPALATSQQLQAAQRLVDAVSNDRSLTADQVAQLPITAHAQRTASPGSPSIQGSGLLDGIVAAAGGVSNWLRSVVTINKPAASPSAVNIQRTTSTKPTGWDTAFGGNNNILSGASLRTNLQAAKINTLSGNPTGIAPSQSVTSPAVQTQPAGHTEPIQVFGMTMPYLTRTVVDEKPAVSLSKGFDDPNNSAIGYRSVPVFGWFGITIGERIEAVNKRTGEIIGSSSDTKAWGLWGDSRIKLADGTLRQVSVEKSQVLITDYAPRIVADIDTTTGEVTGTASQANVRSTFTEATWNPDGKYTNATKTELREDGTTALTYIGENDADPLVFKSVADAPVGNLYRPWNIEIIGGRVKSGEGQEVAVSGKLLNIGWVNGRIRDCNAVGYTEMQIVNGKHVAGRQFDGGLHYDHDDDGTIKSTRYDEVTLTYLDSKGQRDQEKLPEVWNGTARFDSEFSLDNINYDTRSKIAGPDGSGVPLYRRITERFAPGFTRTIKHANGAVEIQAPTESSSIVTTSFIGEDISLLANGAPIETIKTDQVFTVSTLYNGNQYASEARVNGLRTIFADNTRRDNRGRSEENIATTRKGTIINPETGDLTDIDSRLIETSSMNVDGSGVTGKEIIYENQVNRRTLERTHIDGQIDKVLYRADGSRTEAGTLALKTVTTEHGVTFGEMGQTYTREFDAQSRWLSNKSHGQKFIYGSSEGRVAWDDETIDQNFLYHAGELQPYGETHSNIFKDLCHGTAVIDNGSAVYAYAAGDALRSEDVTKQSELSTGIRTKFRLDGSDNIASEVLERTGYRNSKTEIVKTGKDEYSYHYVDEEVRDDGSYRVTSGIQLSGDDKDGLPVRREFDYNRYTLDDRSQNGAVAAMIAGDASFLWSSIDTAKPAFILEEDYHETQENFLYDAYNREMSHSFKRMFTDNTVNPVSGQSVSTYSLIDTGRTVDGVAVKATNVTEVENAPGLEPKTIMENQAYGYAGCYVPLYEVRSLASVDVIRSANFMGVTALNTVSAVGARVETDVSGIAKIGITVGAMALIATGVGAGAGLALILSVSLLAGAGVTAITFMNTGDIATALSEGIMTTVLLAATAGTGGLFAGTAKKFAEGIAKAVGQKGVESAAATAIADAGSGLTVDVLNGTVKVAEGTLRGTADDAAAAVIKEEAVAGASSAGLRTPADMAGNWAMKAGEKIGAVAKRMDGRFGLGGTNVSAFAGDTIKGGIIFAGTDTGMKMIRNAMHGNSLFTDVDPVTAFIYGAATGGALSVIGRGIGLAVTRIPGLSAWAPRAAMGEPGRFPILGRVFAVPARWAGSSLKNAAEVFKEGKGLVTFAGAGQMAVAGPFFTAIDAGIQSIYATVSTGHATLSWTNKDQGVGLFEKLLTEPLQFAQMSVWLGPLMRVAQATPEMYTVTSPRSVFGEKWNTFISLLSTGHRMTGLRDMFRVGFRGESAGAVVEANLAKMEAEAAARMTGERGSALSRIFTQSDSAAFVSANLFVVEKIAYHAMRAMGMDDKSATEMARNVAFFSLIFLPAYRPGAGFEFSPEAKEEAFNSAADNKVTFADAVPDRIVPLDLKYKSVRTRLLNEGVNPGRGAWLIPTADVSARVVNGEVRFEGMVGLEQGQVEIKIDGYDPILVAPQEHVKAPVFRISYDAESKEYGFRLAKNGVETRQDIQIEAEYAGPYRLDETALDSMKNGLKEESPVSALIIDRMAQTKGRSADEIDSFTIKDMEEVLDEIGSMPDLFTRVNMDALGMDSNIKALVRRTEIQLAEGKTPDLADVRKINRFILNKMYPDAVRMTRSLTIREGATISSVAGIYRIKYVTDESGKVMVEQAAMTRERESFDGSTWSTSIEKNVIGADRYVTAVDQSKAIKKGKETVSELIGSEIEAARNSLDALRSELNALKGVIKESDPAYQNLVRDIQTLEDRIFRKSAIARFETTRNSIEESRSALEDLKKNDSKYQTLQAEIIREEELLKRESQAQTHKSVINRMLRMDYRRTSGRLDALRTELAEHESDAGYQKLERHIRVLEDRLAFDARTALKELDEIAMYSFRIEKIKDSISGMDLSEKVKEHFAVSSVAKMKKDIIENYLKTVEKDTLERTKVTPKGYFNGESVPGSEIIRVIDAQTRRIAESLEIVETDRVRAKEADDVYSPVLKPEMDMLRDAVSEVMVREKVEKIKAMQAQGYSESAVNKYIADTFGIKLDALNKKTEIEGIGTVTTGKILAQMLTVLGRVGEQGISLRAGQLDTIRVYLNAGEGMREFMYNATAGGKTFANIFITKLRDAQGLKTDICLPKALMKQMLEGEFIEGVTYEDIFELALFKGSDAGVLKLNEKMVDFDEIVEKYNNNRMSGEQVEGILNNARVLVFSERAWFLAQNAYKNGHHNVINALRRRLKDTLLILDEAHLYMKNTMDLIIAGDKEPLSETVIKNYNDAFEALQKTIKFKGRDITLIDEKGEINTEALKFVAEGNDINRGHIVFNKEFSALLGARAGIGESIVTGMYGVRAGRIRVRDTFGVKPISEVSGQTEYSRDFQDVYMVLGAGKQGGLEGAKLHEAARQSRTTSAEGLFSIINGYYNILAASGTPPDKPILELWGFRLHNVTFTGGVPREYIFSDNALETKVQKAVELSRSGGKDVQIAIQDENPDAVIKRLTEILGSGSAVRIEDGVEFLSRGGYGGKIAVGNRIIGLGVDFKANLELICDAKYSGAVIRQANGRVSRGGEYGRFFVVADREWIDAEFGKMAKLQWNEVSSDLAERVRGAGEGRNLTPDQKLTLIQEYMDARAESQVYIQTVSQYLRDRVVERIKKISPEKYDEFTRIYFERNADVVRESQFSRKGDESSYSGREQLEAELRRTVESLRRTMDQMGMKEITNELDGLELKGSRNMEGKSLRDAEENLQDIVDIGYSRADSLTPVDILFELPGIDTFAQRIAERSSNPIVDDYINAMPKAERDAFKEKYPGSRGGVNAQGCMIAFLAAQGNALLAAAYGSPNNDEQAGSRARVAAEITIEEIEQRIMDKGYLAANHITWQAALAQLLAEKLNGNDSDIAASLQELAAAYGAYSESMATLQRIVPSGISDKLTALYYQQAIKSDTRAVNAAAADVLRAAISADILLAPETFDMIALLTFQGDKQGILLSGEEKETAQNLFAGIPELGALNWQNAGVEDIVAAVRSNDVNPLLIQLARGNVDKVVRTTAKALPGVGMAALAFAVPMLLPALVPAILSAVGLSSLPAVGTLGGLSVITGAVGPFLPIVGALTQAYPFLREAGFRLPFSLGQKKGEAKGMAAWAGKWSAFVDARLPAIMPVNDDVAEIVSALEKLKKEKENSYDKAAADRIQKKMITELMEAGDDKEKSAAIYRSYQQEMDKLKGITLGDIKTLAGGDEAKLHKILLIAGLSGAETVENMEAKINELRDLENLHWSEQYVNGEAEGFVDQLTIRELADKDFGVRQNGEMTPALKARFDKYISQRTSASAEPADDALNRGRMPVARTVQVAVKNIAEKCGEAAAEVFEQILAIETAYSSRDNERSIVRLTRRGSDFEAAFIELFGGRDEAAASRLGRFGSFGQLMSQIGVAGEAHQITDINTETIKLVAAWTKWAVDNGYTASALMDVFDMLPLQQKTGITLSREQMLQILKSSRSPVMNKAVPHLRRAGIPVPSPVALAMARAIVRGLEDRGGLNADGFDRGVTLSSAEEKLLRDYVDVFDRIERAYGTNSPLGMPMAVRAAGKLYSRTIGELVRTAHYANGENTPGVAALKPYLPLVAPGISDDDVSQLDDLMAEASGIRQNLESVPLARFAGFAEADGNIRAALIMNAGRNGWLMRTEARVRSVFGMYPEVTTVGSIAGLINKGMKLADALWVVNPALAGLLRADNVEIGDEETGAGLEERIASAIEGLADRYMQPSASGSQTAGADKAIGLLGMLLEYRNTLTEAQILYAGQVAHSVQYGEQVQIMAVELLESCINDQVMVKEHVTEWSLAGEQLKAAAYEADWYAPAFADMQNADVNGLARGSDKAAIVAQRILEGAFDAVMAMPVQIKEPFNWRRAASLGIIGIGAVFAITGTGMAIPLLGNPAVLANIVFGVGKLLAGINKEQLEIKPGDEMAALGSMLKQPGFLVPFGLMVAASAVNMPALMALVGAFNAGQVITPAIRNRQSAGMLTTKEALERMAFLRGLVPAAENEMTAEQLRALAGNVPDGVVDTADVISKTVAGKGSDIMVHHGDREISAAAEALGNRRRQGHAFTMSDIYAVAKERADFGSEPDDELLATVLTACNPGLTVEDKRYIIANYREALSYGALFASRMRPEDLTGEQSVTEMGRRYVKRLTMRDVLAVEGADLEAQLNAVLPEGQDPSVAERIVKRYNAAEELYGRSFAGRLLVRNLADDAYDVDAECSRMVREEKTIEDLFSLSGQPGFLYKSGTEWRQFFDEIFENNPQFGLAGDKNRMHRANIVDRWFVLSYHGINWANSLNLEALMTSSPTELLRSLNILRKYTFGNTVASTDQDKAYQDMVRDAKFNMLVRFGMLSVQDVETLKARHAEISEQFGAFKGVVFADTLSFEDLLDPEYDLTAAWMRQYGHTKVGMMQEGIEFLGRVLPAEMAQRALTNYYTVEAVNPREALGITIAALVSERFNKNKYIGKTEDARNAVAIAQVPGEVDKPLIDALELSTDEEKLLNERRKQAQARSPEMAAALSVARLLDPEFDLDEECQDFAREKILSLPGLAPTTPAMRASITWQKGNVISFVDRGITYIYSMEGNLLAQQEGVLLSVTVGPDKNIDVRTVLADGSVNNTKSRSAALMNARRKTAKKLDGLYAKAAGLDPERTTIFSDSLAASQLMDPDFDLTAAWLRKCGDVSAEAIIQAMDKNKQFQGLLPEITQTLRNNYTLLKQVSGAKARQASVNELLAAFDSNDSVNGLPITLIDDAINSMYPGSVTDPAKVARMPLFAGMHAAVYDLGNGFVLKTIEDAILKDPVAMAKLRENAEFSRNHPELVAPSALIERNGKAYIVQKKLVSYTRYASYMNRNNMQELFVFFKDLNRAGYRITPSDGNTIIDDVMLAEVDAGKPHPLIVDFANLEKTDGKDMTDAEILKMIVLALTVQRDDAKNKGLKKRFKALYSVHREYSERLKNEEEKEVQKQEKADLAAREERKNIESGMKLLEGIAGMEAVNASIAAGMELLEIIIPTPEQPTVTGKIREAVEDIVAWAREEIALGELTAKVKEVFGVTRPETMNAAVLGVLQMYADADSLLRHFGIKRELELSSYGGVPLDYWKHDVVAKTVQFNAQVSLQAEKGTISPVRAEALKELNNVSRDIALQILEGNRELTDYFNAEITAANADERVRVITTILIENRQVNHLVAVAENIQNIGSADSMHTAAEADAAATFEDMRIEIDSEIVKRLQEELEKPQSWVTHLLQSVRRSDDSVAAVNREIEGMFNNARREDGTYERGVSPMLAREIMQAA